jgi:ketosteroid isomerase-like protein
MSEENVEIISDAYERWNRGDFGWVTVAAPEFEYVASSGFVGLSGAHRGLEGFTRMLEQFWGEFDEAQAEPQEFIEAGDSVLAVIAFRGSGKAERRRGEHGGVPTLDLP